MIERSPRKLAVIVHADVVGSSKLVQMDEALAHERIQGAFHRFSGTIESYGGIAHEVRGDALVAEFARASDAVAAALAFHASNDQFNKTVCDGIQPQLRIGVALGEVVIADHTVTGEGVVIAQRLEQLAEPGGVCVQGGVQEAIPGRLPFRYTPLGEQEIKGFDDPVRAFLVTLRNKVAVPLPYPDSSRSTSAPERTIREPRVQYAKTTDGASIAFWKIGEGPPLVHMPLVPFSHIEMEWQNTEIRKWYERLARRATLIRYDGRGNGLSQRNVDDHSMGAQLRDLECIVEQVGKDAVTLLGSFHSGPTAITYAARHPERTSHLLLWCTYAHGEAYWQEAQAEGLRVLRQTDYQLFLRTASHEIFGWSDDEQALRYAEIMREATIPEEADKLIAATRAADVRDDLPLVLCPALVMHQRQLRWLNVSLSQDLASKIPLSQLVVLEGSSPLPAAGDIEAAAAVIEDFLGRDAIGGN